MTIKIVDQVDGDLIDAAWALYGEAFADLNAFAVQRHLMDRHEFDEVMADPRVAKYLHLGEDGTLLGLSMSTNDLHAVPLISPPCFERRWPKQYAQRRIWYCGFVATRGDAAAAGFGELVSTMYHNAAAVSGLIALDFCQRTDEVRHMARMARLMLHRLSGDVKAQRIDEQQYWRYEFPPVADAAGRRWTARRLRPAGRPVGALRPSTARRLVLTFQLVAPGQPAGPTAGQDRDRYGQPGEQRGQALFDADGLHRRDRHADAAVGVTTILERRRQPCACTPAGPLDSAAQDRIRRLRPAISR